MHSHWKIIHHVLLHFLKEPKARALFALLRERFPLLHRWPQARLVASFLARRTPPLDLRERVARTLLATTVSRNDGAQISGAILLLAGTLILDRMDRHGGGTPPSTAFLVIFSQLPPTTAPNKAPGMAVQL